MPRLKKSTEEIRPALQERFDYKNVYEVPGWSR